MNIKLISSILAILVSQSLLAQEFTKIDRPIPSTIVSETAAKLATIRNEDPAKTIDLIKNTLPKVKSTYERFNLIFWELSFLYAGQNNFTATYAILKQGQKEGLYYPIRTGNRTWPEYTHELQKQADFEQFMKTNAELLEKDQAKAKAEYFVQLPKGYESSKSYPLLLVVHGGFGSHFDSAAVWQSPQLASDYIVAFLQGSICCGSGLRSFERNRLDKIVSMYKQICDEYAVDTSRVVLGGPSAGGHKSVQLTVQKHIAAQGMLLAYPVKPRDLDEENVKAAAERGVRAALICGEHDWALKGQKELSVIFDKHELPNRFVVFSETGHEFPKDFPKQIDLSLDFIFQSDNR
ncbi:hypothetical protein ACFL6U_26970 [Planctomycetota bacterium]